MALEIVVIYVLAVVMWGLVAWGIRKVDEIDERNDGR